MTNPDPPSYTCPHCGAKSYSPGDLANRYCGLCHHFCDDVDLSGGINLWKSCPRCGGRCTEIIRRIGHATIYEPCGHKDYMAYLTDNLRFR